jgi:hypothetical protein
MLKDLLKLSRKLLILTALSGGLVFMLSENFSAVKAGPPACCWECDAMIDPCDHICDVLPNSPGCALCHTNITQCYIHCDPDPNCVPE